MMGKGALCGGRQGAGKEELCCFHPPQTVAPITRPTHTYVRNTRGVSLEHAGSLSPSPSVEIHFSKYLRCPSLFRE